MQMYMERRTEQLSVCGMSSECVHTIKHSVMYSSDTNSVSRAMLYQVHRSMHNCSPSYLVSKFIKNSTPRWLSGDSFKAASE